ncbi:MAG: hypothetical protein K6B42_04930 [Clostridia bacterium]|nr:hypothetical protein [Clostridia bacterium]
MDSAYRKYQTNLLFSGLAIMAFGLWSAVKLIVYLTLHPELITNYVAIEAVDFSVVKVVFYAIFGLLILFSLLLHFFIGSSAVRDARRKTKLRTPYLIVSVLYGLSLFMSSAHALPILNAEGGSEKMFTTFIIDATSILALVIIIVSSHKLNKIRKMQLKTAGD